MSCEVQFDKVPWMLAPERLNHLPVVPAFIFGLEADAFRRRNEGTKLSTVGDPRFHAVEDPPGRGQGNFGF